MTSEGKEKKGQVLSTQYRSKQQAANKGVTIKRDG